MGPRQTSQREYHVAVSFAGEDREWVEGFVAHLRSLGIRVFYDKFEQARLWGKNLYEHLDAVYLDDAEFFVPIISAHYVGKPWPRKEWQSAQARALQQFDEYVLPIRLDNSQLPGLPETMGYTDAQSMPTDKIASLLAQKLSARLSSLAEGHLVEVAISGSHPTDEWHSLCRELGVRLIESGYRIVSGGTANVGYQVALGAYEHLHAVGADYFQKRSTIVTYTNESHPEFPAVKFGTPIPITVPEVELYRSEFIGRAHAVLSISGAAGTLKEWHLASSLGKPVIPLAITGGSAARIWEDLRHSGAGAHSGIAGNEHFENLNRRKENASYVSLVLDILNCVVPKPPNSSLQPTTGTTPTR